MRGLDITKKDEGKNWWDKYTPTELLKNLTKQEEKVYKDIPYVQGVNNTIPSLPNYEGLVDSPTAQKFFELVKNKNYDLGAKGIANWTNANGKRKTNIDSIDCSGAVCVVKNAMGADYNLTNTGAAKFKSVAKTKGIKPEESVDGDMIVFQTEGGNTDHIGFIVVDDQGRRYIAESSSSYNGTTITPYEERVKDLESRLPNLTYDIVSDNENRPAPKPYNTSYEHLTNDKIEVRPPSKVLDKAKEATKQGAIPNNAVKVEKPIVSGNSWGDRFVDIIKEAGEEIAAEPTIETATEEVAIDPNIDATSKAGDDTEVVTDDTEGVGGAELTEELKGGITDENKQKVIDALDSIPSWMKNAISEDPKVLDDPTFLETLEGTPAGSILDFFTKGLTGVDIFKKDVDDKSQEVPNWMKSIGEKFTSSFAKTTGLGLGDTAKKIVTSGIVDKPKSALADEETVAEEVDYSSPDYINDLPDENGVVGGAGGVATIDDFDADKLKQQIADNKELLGNLNNRQPFEYESQTQWNNDLAGTIADAGRGIVGMIGASEPLPKYSRSEMFKTSMGELTDRRNMGLSDDEIGFAKQMAERGYGYDVKNIRRMAGGSAGVALGNLGRAQGQLYDQYGQLATRDEAVRRQNRADFNRGALQEERVNRMIFEDDLRQAERSKAAAAQLTSESMKNIKDRNQYNRAFGPGSQIYQYNEDVLRDKESSIFYREQANADRELEAKQELERKIAADEKSLFERTGGLSENTVLGGAQPQIREDVVIDETPQIKTTDNALRELGLNKERFDALDDNSKKQVYDKLATMGVGKAKEPVSPENQTQEDRLADYKKEVSQDEATLKRYEENPVAFLEEDIKGWESEPDSEKKTQSLKNLRENLEYLKSEVGSNMETVNRTTQEEADAEFRQLREGETEEQWNARMANGADIVAEDVATEEFDADKFTAPTGVWEGDEEFSSNTADMIFDYESTSGSATGGGLGDYGFTDPKFSKPEYNKYREGGKADAPLTREGAQKIFDEEYMSKVPKRYPSVVKQQLADWQFNTGRSNLDLLLVADGKITVEQAAKEAEHSKEWDAEKARIEKDMKENPEAWKEKIKKAKHAMYKDLDPSAYEKTWKKRIEMFD